MGKFDLSQLVGTEIVMVSQDNNVGNERKKTKWNVIEAYPHFVRVMRITENGDEIYNTFHLGDLIEMGVLRQKGRMLYD